MAAEVPNPKQSGTDSDEGKRYGAPDKTTMRGARYIAVASQLPFMILGGYGLGYALDSYFSTTYLRIVFTLVAIFGAFYQLIREVMRDSARDAAEQAAKTSAARKSRKSP